MSETCNHDCGSCGTTCGQDTRKKDFHEAPNELSTIRHVIAVVSGKGGVGKSLVTSLLAVSMQRLGYRTAILDADITGPSIPQAFGIREKAESLGEVMLPAVSRFGTQVMSINLLLEQESDPVVWRGPVIARAVGQFWTDVYLKDVDFMFVDMPPGTGDVPLTVFQSIPVDGIIVMTSPQDLVSMIVGKAVKMAKMMNIPLLGVIENYSYLECPDCGRHIEVFGKSRVDAVAAEYGLPVLAKLPIDPKLAEAVDAGAIEDAKLPESLRGATDVLEKLLED